MVLEGFEKKTFRTNGINLNCLFKGKGEPIILLHGYPQCNLTWHKIAGKLSEKFSVLAPDLRGYGESDKPDASNEDHSIYCKRTTGQDIVELADIFGFDKFHLVGHDRGARVGHRMALDFPDRILSLVSLDVMPSQAAFDAMDADLAFAWFHWNLMRQPFPLPETLIGNSSETYFDFLMTNWCATENAIPDKIYQRYKELFCAPECIHATCAEYRSVVLDLEHDETDRGKKISCPFAVYWGSNTTKRPGWQTGKSLSHVSAWEERAEFVEGEALDCGHFIPEEKPAELLELLFKFYEKQKCQ